MPNRKRPRNLAPAIRVTTVRRSRGGKKQIILTRSCLNEEGEFVSSWQRVISALLDSKVPSNSKHYLFFFFETVCSVVFDLERLDGLLFATCSVLIVTVKFLLWALLDTVMVVDFH